MEQFVSMESIQAQHPFVNIQPHARTSYENGVPALSDETKADLAGVHPHYTDPKFLEAWKGYKEEVNTWSAILIDRIYGQAESLRATRPPFGLIEPDPTMIGQSRIVTDFPLDNPYKKLSKAIKHTLGHAVEAELAYLQNEDALDDPDAISARHALQNLQTVLSFGHRTMKSQKEDPVLFIKNGIDTAAEVFGDMAGLVPTIYEKQYGYEPTPEVAREILSASFLQIRDFALMHFSLFVATYQKMRHNPGEQLQSFDIAEVGKLRYLKLNDHGKMVSHRLHEEIKARVIRGDFATGCPAMVNLHGRDGSVIKRLHSWVTDVSSNIYDQSLRKDGQYLALAAD